MSSNESMNEPSTISLSASLGDNHRAFQQTVGGRLGSASLKVNKQGASRRDGVPGVFTSVTEISARL